MEPLVSILIPTYNRRVFVQEAVASCLSQTYPHLEVIVLDDGSTDDTQAWGEALTDPRIHYAYKPHRGVDALATMTNEMLESAQGHYVALLDADDYYLDSLAIETLIAAIRESGAAMVFGSLQPIDSTNQPLPVGGPFTLPHHQRLNCNAWSSAAFMKELLKSNFIPANANLIDGSVLRSIGGFQAFPGFPAQDYHVWLALALSHRIHWVDHAITAWRIHGGQTTSSRGMDLATGAFRVSQYYFAQAVDRGLLNPEDWPEIEKARKLAIARTCWGQVQRHAPAHEWQAMRAMAKSQIVLGDRPLKVEGMIAYGASYLHVDLITPLLTWAARHQLRLNS